jgi:hypothetical protein
VYVYLLYFYLCFQTSMNVPVSHVKMMVVAKMVLTPIHVIVKLVTLAYVVKQVQ